MGTPAKVLSEDRGAFSRRLRETLQRTAMERDAVLAEAHKPITDGDALLRSVIEEIDGAILPRKIAVVSPNGVEAAMVLANRRMLELGSTGAEIEPDGDSDGRLASLTYAQVLRKIGEVTPGVSLKRLGRAVAPTTSSASCSAATLEQASARLQRGNRLLAFFQSVRGCAKACVLHQGADKGVRQGGQKDLLQRLDLLDRIAETQHATRKGLKTLGRAEPTCIVQTLGAGHQMVIATDGDERLLAAIGAADCASVLSTWQFIYSNS
ncbi:hypothetical protein N4R57_16455 [Rhodobacteraceae bacterium D3-12]|nr:hypothetical protein N4R57_16455 [Rhodobacteraceae bacterium D3-12]